MKVKDLIKLLQQENQELTVVFWNLINDQVKQNNGFRIGG